MSAVPSALAQTLAQHPDDDVLQALSLLVSLRPGLGEGLANLAREMPAPRYSGWIANFTWERCFGFIESEAAKAEFGKDVFLSDKEIGNYNVGDEVSFTVVVNKDGRPQARLLMSAREAPPSVSPLLPQVVVPPPAAPPRQFFAASYAHTGVPQGNNGEERYTGRISSFHPERHYGFIECEAVHNLFGKDTFLSDQELGHFNLGDTVTFSIAINKDGRPQARNLQSPAPPARSLIAPGKRLFPESVHVPPPPPRKTARVEVGTYGQQDVGDRFVGEISSFFPEKHYGFIKSDGAHTIFGKDTFLSNQEIGSFSVGSVVSFRVEMNKRGQPQARDLEAAQC